ncbi:hypothetical protein R3P38DRAFT_2792009 [Favolaschia claudopus]|uniref:F-box domain-containing protein n=1 Tax=Favolaschia claudopus TaxID=2862362 RepID=A0AAW0AG89_9AGAR
MAATLLQTFPYEVLSEIFLFTVASGALMSPKKALALSHVCQQWHYAALSDSTLWIGVAHGLCTRDLLHVDTVVQLLRRSGTRQIGMSLDFTETPNAQDVQQLRRLLIVVRLHLPRIHSLYIRASYKWWQEIIGKFFRETFPVLRSLDIEVLCPPRVRYSQEESHILWFNSLESQDPMPTRPAPHPPVTFPFPRSHALLEKVYLSGITLTTPCLPSAQLIRIGTNSIHNLLGSDGRLNRWLLDGPMGLAFEDFDVLPMERYRPQNATDIPRSTVTHIMLNNIRAAYSGRPDDEFEHSCVQFFDALFRSTPLVRCLALVDWDLESRVWRDFVRWLGLRYSQTTHRRPFPNVIELRMHGMFEQFNERRARWFLSAFPLLRTIRIERCREGTWEMMLDALRHDDTLCPSLKRIRLDDGLMVYRYSPFPFASVDADAWPMK